MISRKKLAQEYINFVKKSYPIAVIKDSDHPEIATELIEFLTTPEAQEVFENYGFDSVISH